MLYYYKIYYRDSINTKLINFGTEFRPSVDAVEGELSLKRSPNVELFSLLSNRVSRVCEIFSGHINKDRHKRYLNKVIGENNK